MSNHRKKLQILQEQANSAKSIEKDLKARSKAAMETIDVDHFIEENYISTVSYKARSKVAMESGNN